MASVLAIMGSDSDWDVMKKCMDALDSFGVDSEFRVISAHRTPEVAARISKSAAKNGVKLIICAAGMAAHLAGAIAANTTLPVIGVPIASGALAGKDALYSTVMMPPGVPVATVGINGAKNAALLAVQILALSDSKLSEKFAKYKSDMGKQVKAKDKKLMAQIKSSRG